MSRSSFLRRNWTLAQHVRPFLSSILDSIKRNRGTRTEGSWRGMIRLEVSYIYDGMNSIRTGKSQSISNRAILLSYLKGSVIFR